MTATRVFAALVGLAFLIPAMVWGGSIAVEIIVPLAAVICMDEYAAMAFPDDKPATFAWMLLVGAAVYTSPLYFAAIAPIVVMLAALATFTFVTLRPGAIEQAADRVGRLLIGPAWVGGCLTFIPLLRRLDHGLAWVFLLLALAWLSDTGGYFAGRFFGRTKLYERISPKKTVEGYLGGIILATVGVVVMREIALPSIPITQIIVIGPVLATAGVLGDLAESMLKRSYNVKDSGWIMPGHGGLLDRIDSVMFIAPLLYAYAVLIQGNP